MRCFSWDYDNDLAIEYERIGECNGCAECCIAQVSFSAAVAKGKDTRFESPYPENQEGVWAEAASDDLEKRYFIKLTKVDKSDPTHRCPELTSELKCAAHAYKPTICREWPFHPNQVSPFESCSYTFKEIKRWKISELPTTLPVTLAEKTVTNSDSIQTNLVGEK